MINHNLTALLWASAGAIIFLSFGYTEMQGSDLWWHVAAGREILQTNTLWMVDDWSFSALGAPWTNHEWLSDLVYYQWVQAFGLESLVYWKWLVVICCYGTLQYVLFRQSGSLVSAFVCSAIAIAVAAPFIDIRPHLYSLLGFSILLLMLLNRKAVGWKLTLLFMVWVNLHGGFFFGLMALAVLLFPWRELTFENFKTSFIIGLLCLLASALNPSGFKSVLYPLAYAFNPASPYRQLGEWLPPFASGGIQAPLFIWVAVLTPIAALSYLIPYVRKNVSIPWEGLLLCGLTLAMSLTSRRFIPLFAMCFAVILAPLLGLVFQKLKADTVSFYLSIVAVAFAVFRMAPYPINSGPAYHYLTAEYSYPIDTVNYVEANNLSGNVFALYNWGGYLHWRTDGNFKVFIDGRADTVYDDATYNQYVDVLRGKQGWQELVESSGADYFLWPYNLHGGVAKYQALVSSGRWVLVYQDSLSYLLARNTVKLAENPNPSPATPYRMLAAAQLNAFRGDAVVAALQAKQVLKQIPYQRGACNLAVRSLDQTGKKDEAKEISRRCKSIFPSRYLL